MTGAHRTDRWHDQLLAIAGVVICSFIVAVAALVISVHVRGGLVPAVNVQVRREVARLHCSITGTGPSRVDISCAPGTPDPRPIRVP